MQQRIALKWHLIFWFGLIIVGTAALSPYYVNIFKATLHRVVFIPVWLIASYVNLEVLLKKFWDRGKKGMYVFTLSTFILALTTIQRIVCIKYIYPKYFWVREPNLDELNPFWIGPFIQFAAFISLPVVLSTCAFFAWRWYQDSYKAKQLIAKQQEAELNYLKAQINPHFLFNTLNSLYGLSLESSKKVPKMILQLSELLSYSLYESKVEEVSIEKEMNLVQNLINLESERYDQRVSVNVEIDEKLNLNTPIAPLLLIPLVENAFKHGISNSTEKENIDIQLYESNDFFTFEIKNRTIQSTTNELPLNGGLGLKNLRRRLELHYPNHHKLEIKNKNNTFYVYLSIKLNA